MEDVDAAIDYAKNKGVRVNLALMPETKIETVTPYLGRIDGVLMMTVEPGSYCIKKEFRPEPLKKIERLREIDEDVPIEVDGCMNPKNARLARESGVNIFASGSYTLKSDDIEEAIKDLEDAVT